MIRKEQLLSLLKETEPEVIAFRRWFHEHPELSLQEKETSEKIVEIIKEQQIPYEIVGDYGIIATIHGQPGGKTVLLRADMDALPVDESEENLCGKKACVSQTPGVSHACGHDAHMAMNLGAMLVLNKLRGQLKGDVLLVFEQAEEIGKGIDPMMEALKHYHIDTCYGTHVFADLEEGRISVQPGPRMAALTAFTVRVRGKGGHGSRPDLTVNPLMCIAQILVNLNSIWTGEIDPTKTVTLGIGAMHCGEKGNVIADEGTFAGSMRYYDVEEGKKAFDAVKRVCECVAAAHRCTIHYDRVLQSNYAVINDETCSERAAKGIEELFGSGVVAQCDPWFGTESMALYLDKYPGVFAFLGIDNKEKGYGGGHHTKEFDFNEEILLKGTGAAVKYAIDSLEDQE